MGFSYQNQYFRLLDQGEERVINVDFKLRFGCLLHVGDTDRLFSTPTVRVHIQLYTYVVKGVSVLTCESHNLAFPLKNLRTPGKKYYPAILFIRSSNSRVSTANTHTLQPSYYVRVLSGFKLQSFERGARGCSRAAGVAGASRTPSSHAKNLLKRPR